MRLRWLSSSPSHGASSGVPHMSGSKKLMYLRNVIGELIGMPETAVQHVVDNSATPPLTENLGVAKKSEHYRRWLHFMRYCVIHGYSFIHLCSTHDMYADCMTKVANKHAYLTFAKVFFNIRK